MSWAQTKTFNGAKSAQNDNSQLDKQRERYDFIHSPSYLPDLGPFTHGLFSPVRRLIRSNHGYQTKEFDHMIMEVSVHNVIIAISTSKR